MTTPKQRHANFRRLLDTFPEVILLARVADAYRLIHYEWPQSEALLFYPAQNILVEDGQLHGRGFSILLKRLGLRKAWSRLKRLEKEGE